MFHDAFRIAQMAAVAAGLVAVCFPAWATDAEPQHVWVHYDYMVFPPGFIDNDGNAYPHGLSFEPPRRAIEKVVDAFAAQGLTLHIDPIHNAIPGHLVLIPDFNPYWKNPTKACVGPDAVSFLALKQQYFQPHGDHPWHYAIFGYSHRVPDTVPVADRSCPFDPNNFPIDPGSSGFSELPGFNFIMAMGTFIDYTAIPIGSVSDNNWGGIFMHELGHNFGLEHGGVITVPCYLGNCLDLNEAFNAYKPNYISVMNYRYNANGIPYAATPGSNTPVDYHLWRLDYSSFTGLTLNEADLNEFAGVGGPPGDTDLAIYCCKATIPYILYGPSAGPIDWNNDGVIEAHVAADIDFSNDDLADGGLPIHILHGFDDWSYVKQQLQIAPEDIDRGPKRAVP